MDSCKTSNVDNYDSDEYESTRDQRKKITNKKKSSNKIRSSVIEKTKNILLQHSAKHQEDNSASGARDVILNPSETLEVQDSLSRIECLETDTVCVSTLIINSSKNKNQNKVIIGINDPKSEDNIKISFKKIINPNYHETLIKKYISKFYFNYKNQNQHKYSINGYMSVKDFQQLTFLCRHIVALTEDYPPFFPKIFLDGLTSTADLSDEFLNFFTPKHYELLLQSIQLCIKSLNDLKTKLT